ncbi:C40 family peptidase [Salipaludibacillus aurantiacus]|uniref:NlpC/P60 family protein n=1 Tax=Salipaludibacillus aurantiacus TaxID=1601833 RepID=A0A1H9SKM8_9BACI|nr:C40 family peptidase [Salipaludibacillus aurantiacus]SER85245.1 NlpC/P60 family protein [Salipaludibacillus aurantiacus]
MTTHYIVRVPVATVWTSPEKPRNIDQKALSYPVDLSGWLEGMTTDERRQLTDDNIVQTQALYGQTVTLIEEKDEWLHVYINEQPSSKLEKGYPGWLPKQQAVLYEDSGMPEGERPFAVVTAPSAWLYKGEEKYLEVSYQTRLPLKEDKGESDGKVTVFTPDGTLTLKKRDVEVYSSLKGFPHPSGQDLVRSGEKFQGLPYLWGGMSGFGFDCSGFVYTLHRAWGITIPRDASDQEKSGTPVERKGLLPGDLIYFAKDEGKGNVYHVGMYYGDGKMIHAPSAGKAIEAVPIAETKYGKNYHSARRFW